jgi:hypothetical protein
MRRVLSFACAAGLALMLVGHNAAPAFGDVTPQTEVRPVHWHVKAVEGRRSITMGWSQGTCSGTPRVDHVKVVWRRKLRDKFRAVITVFVRLTVTPAAVEPEPGIVNPVRCPKRLLKMQKRIKLARPISELMLFDGSILPPPRRLILGRPAL